MLFCYVQWSLSGHSSVFFEVAEWFRALLPHSVCSASISESVFSEYSKVLGDLHYLKTVQRPLVCLCTFNLGTTLSDEIFSFEHHAYRSIRAPPLPVVMPGACEKVFFLSWMYPWKAVGPGLAQRPNGLSTPLLLRDVVGSSLWGMQAALKGAHHGIAVASCFTPTL